MDAATAQFLTNEVNYVKEDSRFFPGIVILERVAAIPSANEPGEESGEAAQHYAAPSPDLVEVGTFFVDERRVRTCNACDQPGHVKAECPTPDAKVECRKCGMLGHRKNDCSNKPAKRRQVCANCDSDKHKAAACSEPCSNCGSVPANEGGHALFDCSAGPKQVLLFSNDITSKDATSQDPASQDTASKEEKTGNAATYQAIEEDGVPPPLGVDSEDAGSFIKVTLISLLSNHISAITIQMRATYSDSTRKSGRDCKMADARFTAQNTEGEIDVAARTLEDAELHRVLSPKAITALEKIVEEAPETSIQHVTWIAKTDELDLSSPNCLGLGLFSNNTYGPYTSIVHAVRDTLLSGSLIKVHFVGLGQGQLSDRMDSANHRIRHERDTPPMRAWYRHDKVHVQRGQQLPKEDRPEYTISPRYQFDGDDEWLTIGFYGAIGELDADKAAANFVRTAIRLVRFQENGQSAFLGLIQMHEDLSVPADAHIKVRFLGPGAPSYMDWDGRVVPATAFGSGFEIHAFLRRPQDNNRTLIQEPRFDKEHFIDAVDMSPDTLRQAVHAHPGITVHVAYNQPKSHLEHEVNTLRIVSEKPAVFTSERSLVRNNSFLALPVLDFFAPDVTEFGQDKVDQAMAAAVEATALELEQLKFFPLLKQVQGGVLCVQGPGGVGKSRLIEAVAVYRYILNAEDLAPTRGGAVWIVSPINAQLNDLTMRVNKTLLRVWQTATDAGKHWRYPLVIRHHARATDKAIYTGAAHKARAEMGIDPDVYEEAIEQDGNGDDGNGDDGNDVNGNGSKGNDVDGKASDNGNGDNGNGDNGNGDNGNSDKGNDANGNDNDGKASDNGNGEKANDVDGNDDDGFASDDMQDDDILAMLDAALVLREAYSKVYSGVKDKRTIPDIALAEGQLMLDRAGVCTADGTQHPIAHPDAAKYEGFRYLLSEYGRGIAMDKDRHTELTQWANALCADLAKLSDVRCMTHHVLSEARQHNASKPVVVCHDEAAKAGERATYHPLFLTKNYSPNTVDSAEETDRPIIHIFAGDPLQPSPSISGAADKDPLPFSSQSAVSLFTRLLMGGATSLSLTRQHRFVPDIAALVNRILPGAPLETDPSTLARPHAAKAREFIKTQLEIDSAFVFVDVSGEAAQNEFSRSWYNVQSAEHALFLVMTAIESHNFRGEEIAIIVPYNAQRNVYLAGLHTLAQYYANLDANDPRRSYAAEARKVVAATIDGIQGQEVPLVFVDFTITEKLGFNRDPARIMLAITRPQSGLVVLANSQSIEAGYGTQLKLLEKTAFGQMVAYAKEKKLFRDLQATETATQAASMLTPFNLMTSLRDVHNSRTHEAAPFQMYETPPTFCPPVPAWAPNRKSAQCEDHQQAFAQGSWDSGPGQYDNGGYEQDGEEEDERDGGFCNAEHDDLDVTWGHE